MIRTEVGFSGTATNTKIKFAAKKLKGIVRFVPLHSNRIVQVVQCTYKGYYFIERSYLSHNFLEEPTYFYSFYVGKNPVVFKNSITADDSYEEGHFYVVFKTLEEMIEFLENKPTVTKVKEI